MSTNPYQSPAATEGPLPPKAVKKATNLVRDSQLAVVVGLIPVLSLIYVLRLVQWYLLRKQYPILVAGDAGEHAALAKDFRAARGRLWFAVLLWPVAIPSMMLISIVYFSLT